MFYSDYHLHSTLSFDGKSEMEAMIKEAIKKGLEEIVFTEHLDYRENNYILPLPDFEKYFNKFEKMKKKYAEKIILKKGLELGLQPELQEKIENMIKDYEFDFIIGSSHIVNEVDFVDKVYFENKTKQEAYDEYFFEVLECVEKYNDFDVYGHLDFIKRYGIYDNNEIEYKKHHDVLKKILQNLIYKGKGIEVNTSGYKYGLNCLHPSNYILKLYKELGGEIITVGSDSHETIHIADSFDIAYEMLQQMGFKYFYTFENRKPVPKTIKKFSK